MHVSAPGRLALTSDSLPPDLLGCRVSHHRPGSLTEQLADKREPCAELGQLFAGVAEQAELEHLLRDVCDCAQDLNIVGVLECFVGEIRLRA